MKARQAWTAERCKLYVWRQHGLASIVRCRALALLPCLPHNFLVEHPHSGGTKAADPQPTQAEEGHLHDGEVVGQDAAVLVPVTQPMQAGFPVLHLEEAQQGTLLEENC